MVNKKTRRKIGNFLVWGGLGVILATNIYAIVNQHYMNFNSNWWNIFAVGATIFGGLWGMRG